MNIADVHAGSCLIKNIDGLIGQMSVAHIPHTQIHACLNGLGRVNNAMVFLVFFTDIVQNLHAFLRRSRFNHHHLETAFQRSVLFNVLTVFIEGGSPYALNFAPCQSGLEHVAGIQRTTGTASTHNGMNLIDEQNYVVSFLQLHHQSFHALFKLTAVFGSGHHTGNIQTNYALVEQHPANLALNNAQRKSLGDGRFTHPGFSNQNGVIFLAAAENLTNTLYLFFAAYNGIQLPFLSRFGEIPAKVVQNRCFALAFAFSCFGGFLLLAIKIFRIILIVSGCFCFGGLCIYSLFQG